jgi:manganese transport protein
MFTADRRKMGDLVAPRWLTAAASVIAVTIIVLNAKLIVDFAIGR